jgi:hypothetical protein
MRDRPPPPMIAGPMIRIGRLVRTMAPLAGSPASGPSVSVGFTRGAAWTDAVVKRLGEATASLLGPADRVTAAPIAQALVDAHRRGVRADILLETDTRTEQYFAADVLAHQGVPTMIAAEPAMAHHKVRGIDGEAVSTESVILTRSG